MNIVLCGLPMCGKSTIGKLLAKRLQWRFVDTDELIENAYMQATQRNYSCPQIYKTEGESYFRELESQQIASLTGAQNTVIAIGGGALNVASNREILKSIGSLIYLKTDLEVLWSRTADCGKPVYLDQSNPKEAFWRMAATRIPIYEEVASATIDMDNKSQEEILKIIENIYGK